MDLKLIETGSGGDLIRNAKGLEVINGFQNMPYLAMFGGNPGYPTPIERLENAQANDWWANSLLFVETPNVQMNSLTQDILTKVALTSSGAFQIEQAVKKDLEFMSEFANLDISVTICSDNRVAIGLVINEPEGEQDKAFIFIWDATRQELCAIPDEVAGEPMRLFIRTPEGEFILSPEANKLLFL